MANITVIGQQNVTLTSGQSLIVSFTWQPNVLVRASYNITSRVQLVTGDPNSANNSVQGGLFSVRLRGDVSGDCTVDIVDISMVGSRFAMTPAFPRYLTAADLNNDGIIDVVDLVLVGGNFARSC